MSVKTAVLVSGGGTNLQALIDAAHAGKLPHADICLVLSNRADAYALTRAQKAGLSAAVCERKKGEPREAFEARMLEILRAHGVEMLVLAGFMAILSKEFVQNYAGRILNVHPSLIPSFCGKGFYGLHVHEAVLKSGVKVTGATVHFVNEVCDGGAIILQKAVDVKNGDTPESLQKRVMEEAEWKILPKAVSLFCEDRIKIENGIAVVEA